MRQADELRLGTAAWHRCNDLAWFDSGHTRRRADPPRPQDERPRAPLCQARSHQRSALSPELHHPFPCRSKFPSLSPNASVGVSDASVRTVSECAGWDSGSQHCSHHVVSVLGVAGRSPILEQKSHVADAVYEEIFRSMLLGSESLAPGGGSAALVHVSKELHKDCHEHRKAGRIRPAQLGLSGREPVQ